tara:strand:- start:1416 stop:1796 length:381 start_codon:yes stop_codon:yes gene_type:complete
MWNTNSTPIYLWKNEKKSREVRGFATRNHSNPILGFCQTREQARRALDAELIDDAWTWDTTPGTSAFEAAQLERNPKPKKYDSRGVEIKDPLCLLSTFDLSDDDVLSFGADGTWCPASFSEEYLGR